MQKHLTSLLSALGLTISALQLGCGHDAADAAARADSAQELQRLRETNQELQRLRAENQDLPRLRRDNEEVRRLQTQTEELARLRQENDQLRGQIQAAKPGKRP